MLQSVFRRKISLYSTLVPSRSPVYAICSDFDSKAAQSWIAVLESTTEFTDEHIRAWNVTTWEDAEPLISSLRDDLYKIWTTQRDGLKEIREAASSQLAQEELLLKKLSGSRTGTAVSDAQTSSFTQRRGGRHIEEESDWRRKTKEEEDGWETSKKPSLASNSFRRSNHRTSSRRAPETDDNWRN